jgi:hypothetical protein
MGGRLFFFFNTTTGVFTIGLARGALFAVLGLAPFATVALAPLAPLALLSPPSPPPRLAALAVLGRWVLRPVSSLAE